MTTDWGWKQQRKAWDTLINQPIFVLYTWYTLICRCQSILLTCWKMLKVHYIQVPYVPWKFNYSGSLMLSETVLGRSETLASRWKHGRLTTNLHLSSIGHEHLWRCWVAKWFWKLTTQRFWKREWSIKFGVTLFSDKVFNKQFPSNRLGLLVVWSCCPTSFF